MQMGLHPRDTDRLTVVEFDRFCGYADQLREERANP